MAQQLQPAFLLAFAFILSACATSPQSASTPHDPSDTSLDALIESGDSTQLYAAANRHFDRAQYLAAHRLYRAVLDHDPDHLGALVNIGVCARRLGDVDGAIEWYDRALAVDPTDLTALQNRIIAGLLLGRANESLPLAERQTQLSPEDANAWRQLGNIYRQLGQYEAAIEAFTQAVTLAPRNANHSYHLALVLAAANQLEAAAKRFNQTLNLDPGFREAYAPAVQVLLFLERYDRAWELVAQGQTRGALFDPDLILELQQRSGRVGPG